MSTTEGKQTRKPVINDIKSKKKREEQEGLNNLTLKSRKKGSKRNDQYFQNGKICHVQEHLSWLIIVVLTVLSSTNLSFPIYFSCLPFNNNVM